MLTTGIAWQRLPQELGYGSGMTCWRRLHKWQQAGVFLRLHQLPLAKLRQADRLDLSRAVCDSSSLRALLGAKRPAPAPSTAAAPAANTTARVFISPRSRTRLRTQTESTEGRAGSALQHEVRSRLQRLCKFP